MSNPKLILSGAKTLSLLGLVSLFAPLAAMGQVTTVFQDNFTSGSLSTLNPTASSPGTLTAGRTAYEIASSKNATGTTIASGVMTYGNFSTSSGYCEGQALFTASPITLSTPGQYIELYYTFTDTTTLFNGNANDGEQVSIGLYNSGGSGPTNGTALWSSGLSSSLTTGDIGCTKGWLGYCGDIAYTKATAQASALFTRPAQTAANNLNQGLCPVSGYSSGVNLGQISGVVGQPALTPGSQYTLDLKIYYASATTLIVTNTLYVGAGTGGAVFSSGGFTALNSATVTGANLLTTTFDGLCIGFRPTSSPTTAETMQINNVTVLLVTPVAPGITGLTNETVVAGTSPTLSPTVTGVPAPAYQWYVSTDGGATSNTIAGATNSTLPLANVQYSQNNYRYSLVAANTVGTNAAAMTLSVIVPPSITGMNNQAAGVGTTVNISPTVSGVPTPTLQWQTNGVNVTDGPDANGSTISGSTTSTLTITDAQTGDSGTYSLIASNSAGIVTNSMNLTVSSGNVAPGITGPADQTVVQTSNATFSASVLGLPAPTLQWRVNGTDIPSATNSSLTVSNVQYSQNGFVYSLVASNSVGMATNSAKLYVQIPPGISQPPTNLTVLAGNAATFSVTASGVPAVSYQWNRNGSPIPNATGASYTIAAAQGTDNGAVFSVTVSNSVSAVTSSNATLTVLSTMTGTFLPTNGAVSISPDQQWRIVFSGGSPRLNSNGVFTVRDAADNSLVETIDASQFLSYTPGNTSIQTIPNVAIRTEQGTYFGSGNGLTTYYYMPIALYGNEAWITLTNRLSYGHTYYVNCSTGLFLDSTGASFPGITGTNTWSVSTKASGPATPATNSGPTSITIGQDGAGDFASFQGAFDWIPQSNTLWRTVHVLPGIYRDSATLAGNRNFVTIVGDGASRTNAQLIYPFIYFAPPNPVFTAGSLRIESSDVAVENITLDNIIYGSYHPTGYQSSGAATIFAGAINTLATTGKRIVFDNVLIKGGQDTIYNVSGVIYYHNCEVWGSVDFIYGAALEVFDQCKIMEIRDVGGPCTAPNTANAQPYGITFLSCTFPQAFITDGYPYNVGAATTTFMRPWGQDGMTAAINCTVGNQFSTAGWQTMGNTNETTCRAREYGTSLIGGGLLNVPTNRWNGGAYWVNTQDPDYLSPLISPNNPLLYGPTGTNNRTVVTVNTNDYTLSAIFTNAYFGLNGWMPAILPTVTSQPTNQTVAIGATTAFNLTATGFPTPTFQWLKNGTNIFNATNAALTLTNVQAGDTGIYSVIVSNSDGSITSSNAALSVIPNTSPTNVAFSITSGTLQLSWPADHLGWRLQYQTNSASHGLGTNWLDWPGATNVCQTNIVISPAANPTFFRLIYP